MKTTLKALAAILIVASFLPSALATVPGEKLDSGLGEMVYGESLDSGLGEMVYGESLDSGLGKLSRDYSAHEFMPVATMRGIRIPGEKLDSGLGELTRDEVMRFFPVNATLRASVER
jgi:hypothetical protein